MESNKIRVLVCEQNEKAYVGNLPNTKLSYKRLVGSEYKTELVDKNTVIIYNKAMTENGDMPNRHVGNLIVCGNFLLAAASDGELYKGLDLEQIQYYNAILGKPENIEDEEIEAQRMFCRERIGSDFAYINNINFHMNHSKTDAKQIAESYKTADKTAAKKFLKELHNIFVETFGTNHVDDFADEGEGMIHLPAILKSIKTGDVRIGLVAVDTESSGEHWGTQHMISKGFVDAYDEDIDEQCKAELHSFGAYKYWYTPTYFGDIHVNKSDMPDDVREIINYAVGNDEQTQGMNMQGM